MIGIIDFVHENGFFIDNAEIKIKKFITKSVNNKKKIEINSTLYLNRKDYYPKNFGDKIVKYVGVIFRGSEIYIQPDATIYNIFITK